MQYLVVEGRADFGDDVSSWGCCCKVRVDALVISQDEVGDAGH